jgi:hypothetical protein
MLPQHSSRTGCIDDERGTNANRLAVLVSFQQPAPICCFNDVRQPGRVEKWDAGGCDCVA